MCGINGIFNYSGKSIPDARSLIDRMNRSIAHRGPDDDGYYGDETAGLHLGHRRLSIIDLSVAGHQPMTNGKGQVICFNGEIYNFQEVKDQLPSYPYRSNSDTEVLLHALSTEGIQCLKRLNGMFALAFWDVNKKELLLARDRIGIKPLFYTNQNGILAFSSEMRALLELPWVKKELDETSLSSFLTFNKVEAPATIFKNIRKLEPGHFLRVTQSGPQQPKEYWQVEYSDLSQISEKEASEQLSELLDRAVKRRMVSDVPVGAFLSGGVDSSAVTGMMSRYSGIPVSTYSIGFENAPDYDELAYARKISKQFGTNHFEKIVTASEIRDFVHDIADIYDEPLADATSIPIYFISKAARENGTIVVLTGDGADELFCGYRNWMKYVKMHPHFQRFSQLPKWVQQPILKLASKIDLRPENYEILQRATKGEEFFWGGAGGMKEREKQRLLAAPVQERLANFQVHSEISAHKNEYRSAKNGYPNGSYADWMCYHGLKSIVPNYYLYRADRLGMANSIELRVPFLDHEVVNFALSLPGHLKTKDGEPKAILKKALEPLLSNETLYRKKQGFCVPLKEWTGDIMQQYLEDNAEQLCDQTGLFDPGYFTQVLNAAKSGNDHYTFMLWNLYFLTAWMKRWID